MKKLHLLLLEDDIEQANELTEMLDSEKYQVYLAEDINKARKIIIKETLDIAVLDIMINGKPEGIAFADELNNSDTISIPFIFLTSINDKAAFNKAKYTGAFSYLLKPFNELEVLYALELAIEKHYNQSNTLSHSSEKAVLSSQHIFVKNKRAIKKLPVSSIYYIEVEEKYCNVVCENEKYIIKLSLKKIKEIISSEDFKQVHRKFLINTEHLKEIYPEDNLIIMNNNDKILFSERFKRSFLNDNIIFK